MRGEHMHRGFVLIEPESEFRKQFELHAHLDDAGHVARIAPSRTGPSPPRTSPAPLPVGGRAPVPRQRADPPRAAGRRRARRPLAHRGAGQICSPKRLTGSPRPARCSRSRTQSTPIPPTSCCGARHRGGLSKRGPSRAREPRHPFRGAPGWRSAWPAAVIAVPALPPGGAPPAGPCSCEARAGAGASGGGAVALRVRAPHCGRSPFIRGPGQMHSGPHGTVPARRRPWRARCRSPPRIRVPPAEGQLGAPGDTAASSGTSLGRTESRSLRDPRGA
jgi:hypothetical protein